MKVLFLKCITNNTALNLTRAAFTNKLNGLNLVKQFEINKQALRLQSTSTYGLTSSFATDSKNTIPPASTDLKSTSKSPKDKYHVSSDVLNRMKRQVPNSFALFMKESFSDEKAKNPDLKPIEVVKKLASIWRSMPYDKKSPYLVQADQLRNELKTQKTEILSNKSKEEIENLKTKLTESRNLRRKKLSKLRIKKAKQLSKKPKKPLNSFGLYLQTLDRGDAPITEFAKGAALKWKALATQDKEKFKLEADEKMNQYREDIRKWESQMFVEGKVNLTRKSFKMKLKKQLKELK